MSARSPKSPRVYDQEENDRYRALLDRREKSNRKDGQDIELSTDVIIMQDSVTGFRYKLEIQSGVLVTVPL